MLFNTPRLRLGRIGAITAALALGVSSGLLAHDFWLVPMRFESAPGSALEVHGQTGLRFPTSQSAVAVERVAEARLLGATEGAYGHVHCGQSRCWLRRAPRPTRRAVLQPTSWRVAAPGPAYIGLGTPDRLNRWIVRCIRGFDSGTMKAEAVKAIVGGAGGPALSRGLLV
jgi:hypothetical protein